MPPVRRPPRLPRLLLLAGGGICILAGAGAVVAGVALPDRIGALLPPVVADAAAIGGATVALGLVAVLAGAAQVAIGLWLVRLPWLTAAAALVLAGLAALLIASAAALLTEVAAGASAWLIGPGIGLMALAALYGLAAWMLSDPGGATDRGRR